MSDSVLILGAGSPDGVGGALARRFAREGLHVVVIGEEIGQALASSDPISSSFAPSKTGVTALIPNRLAAQPRCVSKI